MLKIDGKNYIGIVTSLKRNFEVADGENAGRTLDGEMHRDLKGTYYNYTVNIMTDQMKQSEYNELYETISAPVKSHEMEVAYGNGVLIFNAYITQGSDELIREYSSTDRYWGNLTFDFIAMAPQRRAT